MHEPVRLEPGANTSLTQTNPLLDDLVIGFGWKVIPSNGPVTELAPAAVLCDSTGRAIYDDALAFFNQLSAADGSVQYVTGDDEEQLDITLSRVPVGVEKIVFVVFADPDIRKPGSFEPVRDAYIRVADRDGNDLVRFDIPRSDATISAMNFGELYRYNGQWKFRALGDGYRNGLADAAAGFGITL